MLSDEEKKEYEAFKYYYQTNTEKGISYIPDYMCENVLNLIEKQSKEIEELKRVDISNSQIIANMSTRHFNDREKIRKYESLVDKIKAKIEELQEDIKYSANPLSIDNSKFGIKVLQSLLEKE